MLSFTFKVIFETILVGGVGVGVAVVGNKVVIILA
jgi:hypothetical protein